MQRCPSCAGVIERSDRFCRNCGERLVQAAPIAPDPAVVTQSVPEASTRREVTVVFVDVTNFTATSRELDSEEVFVWMDDTLRVLAEVVLHYEGTIDKYTGDGMMALFGAPIAHENDPERAVRAGLEMQAVLEPLRDQIRERQGIDFRVRIGINTGSVVAGHLGGDQHAEYTVLGDAVNIAARLEKAALPGTVLVSTSTYERTSKLFRYEPMPPLLVKGVDLPLQTYRPLPSDSRLVTMRGLAGLRSSMVGRAADLKALQQVLEHVEQSGRSRLAIITGEAGIGKSRLIAELRQSAAEAPFRFFQGACLAHTRSTPLWIVADLIRDIVGLSATEPALTQREQLFAYVIAHGLVADDLLPFLLHALGLEAALTDYEPLLRALDAVMLQNQTHAVVRQLLLAEAAIVPCVLIFDDLHWIDQASRVFLEYLLQTTPDAPIATVLVARESARVTVIDRIVAALPRDEQPPTNILLAELSEPDSHRLIYQLLGNSTDEVAPVAHLIAQRAEGNPFYIEELIRMVIDRGGLVADSDRWHVTPNTQAILRDVPPNLQSLILARFDQLPIAYRTVLQSAAVLGRSFPAPLIDQLGRDERVSSLDLLHDLVERQYLFEEPFGAEQGFAFRHVLIQDAIYGTIMRRERLILHERAAEAIAQGKYWPPDEQAEVLAYHYTEGPQPDRAIPLLLNIAESAARRYANDTAIHRYREAIALMQEYPASYGAMAIRARLGLGRSLKFTGNLDESSQMLGEALDRLHVVQMIRSIWLATMVDVLGDLADVRFHAGALDQAVAYLEQGLAVLGSTAAQAYPQLWRVLMNRLAYVRLRQGDLERAFDLAYEATRDADNTDDIQTLANLYSTLGGVRYEQGQLTEAAQYVERSLDLNQRLNYPWGMANCYTNLGILYYAQGLWQKAVERFSRSDMLRKEIGYVVGQALNRTNLGLLHMALGEHEQARADFETSLAISQRLGDDYGIIRATLGMAHLAVTQAHYSQANILIQQAEGLLGAAGEDEAIQVRWLRALILGATGDLPGGIELAGTALEMARSAGISEQEVESLRVLGHLQRMAHHYAAAQQSLRDLVDLCAQRDDPYQHGLALLELGLLYVNTAQSDGRSIVSEPERIAAQQILNQASTYFTRLGARYDLDIAQQALARI